MQRPVSTIVFGILNIGWGLLGLVGSVFSLVTLNQQGNPLGAAMEQSRTAAAWIKISLPLGIIISLVLIASGLGLLLLKRWGRQLALIYGATQIGLGLIGLIIHVKALAPALIRQLPMTGGGPEAGAIMGAVLGGFFGGLAGIAYCVLLLTFMLRPNVTAVFGNPRQAAFA